MIVDEIDMGSAIRLVYQVETKIDFESIEFGVGLGDSKDIQVFRIQFSLTSFDLLVIEKLHIDVVGEIGIECRDFSCYRPCSQAVGKVEAGGEFLVD